MLLRLLSALNRQRIIALISDSDIFNFLSPYVSKKISGNGTLTWLQNQGSRMLLINEKPDK